MDRRHTSLSQRPTELDYLDTLTEVVTPDAWRAIVERTVADALAGDARARDWLSRWLMGNEGRLLKHVVVAASGPSIDHLSDADLMTLCMDYQQEMEAGGLPDSPTISNLVGATDG